MVDVPRIAPWFVPGAVIPTDPTAPPAERLQALGAIYGSPVVTFYRQHYEAVRTHFWETRRGVRSVYNFALPIETDALSQYSEYLTLM